MLSLPMTLASFSMGAVAMVTWTFFSPQVGPQNYATLTSTKAGAEDRCPTLSHRDKVED